MSNRIRTARHLYLESLEDRRLLAGSVWHNMTFPEDVTGDGESTARDALTLVNFLNQEVGGAEHESLRQTAYLDVNGDLNVTSLDALRVVNRLNQSLDGESPASPLVSPLDHPETHLRTRLAPPTDPPLPAAHGEAEFEEEVEHGLVQRTLEVEVERAEPNAAYVIAVDGISLGEVTTDTLGNGHVKFSSRPSITARPFPADFAGAEDGSVVRVGELLQGTLEAAPESPGDSQQDDDSSSDLDDDPDDDTSNDLDDDSQDDDSDGDDSTGDDSDDNDSDDNSDGDNSDGDDSDDNSDDNSEDDPEDDTSDDLDEDSHDSDGDDSADDSADDSSDDSDEDGSRSRMEFSASLVGAGAAHGEAEYELEGEGTGSERSLEVELERADGDTVYAVRVDGQLVGQLITNALGRGRVKFSTDPEVGELLMPQDFPLLAAGTVVQVGDIVQGVLR